MKINECIVVVGTNLEGRHGKGAALMAKNLFGLQQWCAIGISGRAYGIPTKRTPYESLGISAIKYYIDDFIKFATEFHWLTFLVTPVATGLAGYLPEDIAPLFSGAPDNCILPDGWSKTHRVHHIDSITRADMDKEMW